MSCLNISDDNENIKSYHLDSYEIIKKEESVIVKFNTLKSSIIYELRPDACFLTVDNIIEYFERMLGIVVSKKYVLQVSEFLRRTYVSIGYKTDENYVMKRFTASKLS